jgi:hypothetical protein
MSITNGTMVYAAKLTKETNPLTHRNGLAAYAMEVRYNADGEPDTTQQLELNRFAQCFRGLESPFLHIPDNWDSGVNNHVKLSDDSDPFLMTTTKWSDFEAVTYKVMEMAMELQVEVRIGYSAEPKLRQMIEEMKRTDRWI